MSNDTQYRSIVPLSEATGVAKASVQWFLEQPQDAKYKPFYYNQIQLLICGEEAFREIAKDIRNARKSIDIICWGFDPAMELTRTRSQWPRGETWGDLLRDAAAGKYNGGKPVEVRILVWHSGLGQMFTNNTPGLGKAAPYELKAAPGRGMAEAVAPGGRIPPLPEPTDPRDRREVFNAHWWADVTDGRVPHLSVRMRGGVRGDVLDSLRSERSDLGLLDHLGLELIATHHQKTLIFDYEGDAPRGYVMGLNSVTDYWDTRAHLFNDPRRGASWEGGAEEGMPGLKPYRDYACRVQGDALIGVCKNFVEAWNRAEAKGPGSGTNLSRDTGRDPPPKNLTACIEGPYMKAQIVRTVPGDEGGEKSIHRLYDQAASFARHYLYMENQYFQYPQWIRQIKRHRKAHMEGFQKAGLTAADVTKLHMIVVIPTPERLQMVPRTHDSVTELGHGQSFPNQDKVMREEIERYKATQRVREAASDPLVIPPPRLSDAARGQMEAGGGRSDPDGEQARKELEGQYAMRTLVASLWTDDKAWDASNHPAIQQAQREQAAYDRALREYDQGRALGRTAHSMPQKPGPQLRPQLHKAYASRYREIYIHAKLMIIDDSMFTLGSANLNLRSFAVDSEINIASDHAATAEKLRREVWAMNTAGSFDGANATDQKAMKSAFEEWKKLARDNLVRKAKGEELKAFLVAFEDKRTTSLRFS